MLIKCYLHENSSLKDEDYPTETGRLKIREIKELDIFDVEEACNAKTKEVRMKNRNNLKMFLSFGFYSVQKISKEELETTFIYDCFSEFVLAKYRNKIEELLGLDEFRKFNQKEIEEITKMGNEFVDLAFDIRLEELTNIKEKSKTWVARYINEKGLYIENEFKKRENEKDIEMIKKVNEATEKLAQKSKAPKREPKQPSEEQIKQIKEIKERKEHEVIKESAERVVQGDIFTNITDPEKAIPMIANLADKRLTLCENFSREKALENYNKKDSTKRHYNVDNDTYIELTGSTPKTFEDYYERLADFIYGGKTVKTLLILSAYCHKQNSFKFKNVKINDILKASYTEKTLKDKRIKEEFRRNLYELNNTRLWLYDKYFKESKNLKYAMYEIFKYESITHEKYKNNVVDEDGNLLEKKGENSFKIEAISGELLGNFFKKIRRGRLISKEILSLNSHNDKRLLSLIEKVDERFDRQRISKNNSKGKRDNEISEKFTIEYLLKYSGTFDKYNDKNTNKNRIIGHLKKDLNEMAKMGTIKSYYPIDLKNRLSFEITLKCGDIEPSKKFLEYSEAIKTEAGFIKLVKKKIGEICLTKTAELLEVEKEELENKEFLSDQIREKFYLVFIK